MISLRPITFTTLCGGFLAIFAMMSFVSTIETSGKSLLWFSFSECVDLVIGVIMFIIVEGVMNMIDIHGIGVT